MEQKDSAQEIVQINEPKRRDVIRIRILISAGMISLALFLHWFIQPQHIGNTFLFWLLTFALVFKIVKMCQEWYYYWSPSVSPRPSVSRNYTVDVLTTYCAGEPKEMLYRTLRSIKAIRYPHTTYLCDEANDPEVKDFCAANDIIHVTREIKIDAKAGNINNALKQATGEICLILDPDHEPIPEFLDRVIPYFENEEIGFVQCVQAYGNQSESFIALGAAQQTYHFYGPMMMSMNSYGTVQAIGANCTFRRKALDSIGGHAAGLAEDMHTAMQLHAKGWKSVYVPELLSRGLVPATLSGYYKQQLKWSRGTFELLFRVYPKLFKNFTWRQRLHYFALPHYFLFGLINLIDILVPSLALVSASVPWEMDLVKFGAYFTPICLLSLFVRIFAQRWLLEKHERGFHFAGGILRTATWWIYLLGFIYSIFNIKVPYIPTPKEDEHQNHFVLSLPNIFVVLLSLAAISYGLYIDWTPFSLIMALYTALVCGIMGYIIFISQQRFLLNVKKKLQSFPVLEKIEAWFRGGLQGTEQVVYRAAGNSMLAIPVLLSILFLSYTTLQEDNSKEASSQKNIGSFYLGAINQNIGSPLTGNSVNLGCIEKQWNDTIALFDQLQENRMSGRTPVFQWSAAEINSTKCNAILTNEYDGFLRGCANVFRRYKDPVFITFPIGQTDAKNFVLTWQYLYTFFNNLGISNLTWMWVPKNSAQENYYPGEKFTDWIGVSCLNYAERKTATDWYEFSEIYKPFRQHYGKFEKPVMITELGCQRGALQAYWLHDALLHIREKNAEIKGLVLCNQHKTLKLDKSKIYTADFTLDEPSQELLKADLAEAHFSVRTLMVKHSHPQPYKSPFVGGTPGHFVLKVNGRPVYIRGIAYNTAHDWRDGFMPLTRRQLEWDFDRIKSMGANTIRRYDKSIYDRNILMIAEEKGLQVQYGFWFDPKTDFMHDSARVQEYFNETLQRVEELKDRKSIIAWCLGNETWGLLKHRFAKPYLIAVRRSYVKLIEELAEEIHRIDPDRPVLTAIEHEEYQIAGELVAFHDEAPAIDVMGINSYYKEQISRLNHVAWQFDSLRPYLVSEFGPRGYWDPNYNRTADGALLEEDDSEKAEWYSQQWKNYIAPFKGYNIGGFAYCWHDRMEGSCTWFGLTDFRGRTKAAYYALKQLWTSENERSLPNVRIEPFYSHAQKDQMVFKAIITSKSPTDFNIEWYLHKNEYLERLDDVEYLDDGRHVLVKLPESLQGYRLYLYVSDQQGNVSTCSYPLSAVKKYMQ